MRHGKASTRENLRVDPDYPLARSIAAVMMTIMRPQLLLLALPRVLAALLPRQTDPVLDRFDVHGRSPVPTTLPDLAPAVLRRRTGGKVIGYAAPDNTCAYISGTRVRKPFTPNG
jgi:hypothetical protein